MDYTRLAEMQQNPNPYLNPNPNFSSTLYSAGYPHQPTYQTTNDSHDTFIQPQPPGVDPPYVPPAVTVTDTYAQQPIAYHHQQQQPPYVPPPPSDTVTYEQQSIAYQQQPPYMPPPATETVTYEQQPISFEHQQNADYAASASAASYYLDPNVWAAAISQFGATSYAAGVTTPSPAIQSHRSNNWKKVPKKTKIVQSAWCEICKIDCNSKDVLDQHKLGKKHKKNLEKLKGPTTTIPPPAIASASVPLPVSHVNPINKPVIGPEENPRKGTTSSAVKARKKAARTENLETKRRKVLEGGAAAEAVRSCNICNVVCNSDTVFNYHLAGKSHASMVKKYLSMAGVASAL
ncbi:hypothetical protein ACJIZ3_014715 [Penstemon smallii]|uniref:U1-type domain-containing protein n=1 Tax=Penstemon smallii TaxID=265156 RepID=A0ABD3RKD6_9LAMI